MTSLGVDKVVDLLTKQRVGAEVKGVYLHWDEVRRRPAPAGLDHETWWFLIDYARRAIKRPLRLQDTETMWVANPDSVQRLVHTIDQDASGRIELPEEVVNPPQRDRYILNSLIEEAITSSQLEGASTTRKVAKEMLRTGRTPRNRDERMIRNNLRAMEWIRERKDTAITVDAILELHTVVTEETLDETDAAGRFRRADEDIRVVDHDDDEVLHLPPPADELPARVATMCRFAAGDPDEGFIHPVVRAILLHFWLAFDHPFVDGNGRTARALFYWQMLKSGYWLTEFLSISRVLKKAPSQYARAFLYAESAHDVTHFVLHQLETIRQAIDDLFVYLKRKTNEVRKTATLLRGYDDLNHRQIALIAHALRHADARYTIEAHRREHGVVYQTARQDLISLAALGWLDQRKLGKSFVFTPAHDLERRVSARGKRSP